jgi:hypothetical protein
MILLAVAVSATLIAFMAAWQSVDSQASWSASSKAQGLADACAETARAHLWLDPAYSGSESLTFGTGRCVVMPVAGASASYEIRAEGFVAGTVARTLAQYELSVDASGSVRGLEVLRFERMADF